MLRSLGPLGPTATLLVLSLGCTGSPVLTPDAARYVARDAVVDPRPDADLDASTLEDIGPQVDITPFDAALALDATRDGTVDVPITCQDLADRYVENVQAAQACALATDCTALACATPCCACQVFVQAGTAPYLRLDDLRTQWTAMGCASSAGCPTTGCSTPVSTACSSLGLCVTLRAVGDGGL